MFSTPEWLRLLRPSSQALFDHLPIAAVLNERILCVHGGIGAVETLDQIRAIQRPLKVLDSEVLANLMWSDPTIDGRDGFVVPSRVRGPGFGCLEFGPDIVHAFCARNRIDLIVRGHQVAQNGYDLFAGGRLITGVLL